MVLSLFLLAMAVLTNIVSNNAAAVIGTPIAVATSQQLGADPMPFLLAVLFGANMSFVTPFGYQTNLLILKRRQLSLRRFRPRRAASGVDYVGRVFAGAADDVRIDGISGRRELNKYLLAACVAR